MNRIKMSLEEATNYIRNEKCPHLRRVACSCCEYENHCAAVEKILDEIEQLSANSI